MIKRQYTLEDGVVETLRRTCEYVLLQREKLDNPMDISDEQMSHLRRAKGTFGAPLPPPIPPPILDREVRSSEIDQTFLEHLVGRPVEELVEGIDRHTEAVRFLARAVEVGFNTLANATDEQ